MKKKTEFQKWMYLEDMTTESGIQFHAYIDIKGRVSTSDDLGHEIIADSKKDLLKTVQDIGWVDLLGNFRLTNQDCEYYRKVWLA